MFSVEDFYDFHEEIRASPVGIDIVARTLMKGFTNPMEVPDGMGNYFFLGGKKWSDGLLCRLLSAGKTQHVAALMWGRSQFTFEPQSVQDVWTMFDTSAKGMILGAASQGKSYGLAGRLVLDWLEDPGWTCIKVVSATKEHAKRNVFAHMRNLLVNSAIKIPLSPLIESIQVNKDDKQGIHLVSIPAGESGAGKLQGFHPVPRIVPHPKFGPLSRVRAILDEAEEIPEGVWEDVDNMLATINGTELIKVHCATNPRKKRSKLGQRCEPENGWQLVHIDHTIKWKSRMNWDVIRLDGARSENVVQKREVFPGFLTHQGYLDFLAKGEHDPENMTMARGMFPGDGIQGVVVSESLLASSIGHLIWKGRPKPLGAFDTALEGGDDATYTAAQYGEAIGWQPAGTGQTIMFLKPQMALQIEQIMVLPKADTVAMSKEVVSRSKLLQVEPEQLGIDRTGNGAGVHDYTMSIFGYGVIGVDYNHAASETKMFDDDKATCKELYADITTELMFRIRRYMEFGMLKISPSIDLSRLGVDLTDRRYEQVGRGRLQCEKKKDFKKRNGRSPDPGDSVSILGKVASLQPEFSQVMNREPIKEEQTNRQRLAFGVTDSWENVDFNEN